MSEYFRYTNISMNIMLELKYVTDNAKQRLYDCLKWWCFGKKLKGDNKIKPKILKLYKT